MAPAPQPALSPAERQAIQIAVYSAFTKLRNLYQQIAPIFEGYGFAVPSAGVIARDLSEKIETAIVQHCPSFTKGMGRCDLARAGCEWEVKICKDSGLTINQSKQIHGETYLVINYKAPSQVTRIWVLWNAQETFFSPRKPNSNARALLMSEAAAHIETIYRSPGVLPADLKSPPVKARLKRKRRDQSA